MNKYILSCGLLSALFLSACGDGDRIDQHQGVPVPQGVQIVSVRNTSGGAVVKVKIPDDPNLKGVSATYERNGSVVETRCSRYCDSLELVGYADTLQHEVKVRSFNVNEEYSEAVSATFTPTSPAILLSKVFLTRTFGGIKVHLDGNVNRADLALVLFIDSDTTDIDKPDSERKWKDLDALFTNADSTIMPRRGIEAKPALFGCYIRDRWGNRSEMVTAVLTPMFEQKLPKGKFAYKNFGDYTKKTGDYDNSWSVGASSYPIQGLWDDAPDTEVKHFYASDHECPYPQWLTVDLGVKAKISRIGKWARINYNIWMGSHPRVFEFYGRLDQSMGERNPANPHGFADGWIFLGRYEQGKPSGYAPDGSVGVCTTEDNDYFNTGTEWEMDVETYPNANDPIRYLRIVFVDTFDSYETHTVKGDVQIGEITPWGEILEQYR